MKSKIFAIFPYLHSFEKFTIEKIEFKPILESGVEVVNNLALENEADQYHLNNIIKSFRFAEKLGIENCIYSIQVINTSEEFDDFKRRMRIAANIIRYRLFDKDQKSQSSFPQTSLYLFELLENEWSAKAKELQSGNKLFWYKGLRDFTEVVNLRWPRTLFFPTKNSIVSGFFHIPSNYFLLQRLNKPFWDFRKLTEEERMRMVRAIEHYNRSYAEGAGIDDRDRVLSLSAGFESLLNLPDEGITKAFRSTIVTLLGGISNLGEWSEDFYNLRSKIVHGEEISTIPRVKPSNKEKKTASLYFQHKQGEYEYIKHLEIGQNVFRKCLEIILEQRSNTYIADVISLLEPNEVHIRRIEEGIKRITDKTSITEWYEQNVLQEYDELKQKDGTAKPEKIISIGKELLTLLRKYLQEKNASMDNKIDAILAFKGKHNDLALAYSEFYEDFEKRYFQKSTYLTDTKEYALENAAYNFILFASNVLFSYQAEVKK